MSKPATAWWSARNTSVRMVSALMGLGLIMGAASSASFLAAGLSLERWWPALATALACAATLAFVGTRMNVRAVLGEGGIEARYLLGRRRTWSYREIAWAYVFRMDTSLLGLMARDEALHLVTYDGADLQLSLPPRGHKRESALRALRSLPELMPRAYIGFDAEAARRWRTRGGDPGGWDRFVAGQPEGRRRLLGPLP